MSYSISGTTVIDNNGNYINNFGSSPVTSLSVQKILEPTPAANHYFGEEVLMLKDMMVLCAITYDTCYAFNFDGTYLKTFGTTGSVYTVGGGNGVIGIRSAAGTAIGVWLFDDNAEVFKILVPDGSDDDIGLGASISIGNGRLILGAPNTVSTFSIYDLKGNRIKRLYATDYGGTDSEFFGASSAVGYGRIVIGAQTATFGGQSSAGAAYIFDIYGNFIARIGSPSPQTNETTGRSVAIGCNRIVIGSDGRDSDQGAAYVYDLDGNYIQTLVNPSGTAGEKFGFKVNIGHNRIICTTIAINEGAHAFDLDGNYLGYYHETPVSGGDGFGEASSLGKGKLIVGAWNDTDTLSSQGSVSVFNMENSFAGIDDYFDYLFE